MRPSIAARLLLGSVGLLFTRRVLPLWGADPRSDRVVGVARVLATRHLVQGAVLAVLPSRRTDIASAAVDLLHGLTMVVLAAVSPSYRRPAATSASVALSFAALTGIRLQRDPGLEVLEVEAREFAGDLTRRNEALMAAATDAPMRSMSQAGAMVLKLLGGGGQAITARGIVRPGARRRRVALS